jgi:4-hydroxy-2-oxoheptanedioate aldolase
VTAKGDQFPERSLRRIWGRGDAALGVACVIPSGFAAEIVADTEPDFVMIDRQHGPFGEDVMLAMLQAVSRTAVCPIVRVPPGDTFAIGAALDAGAGGVIVPMVNSRAEAENVTAACRYPPRGSRSYGPLRSSMLLKGPPADVNDQVLCIVQIETLAGVEAADEICSCPGVDGVWVGEADLAVDMGFPPGQGGEAVADAVAAVHRACLTNGIISTTLVTQSAELVQRRIADGYQMIMVGIDLQFLRAGAAKALGR